jgi:hypothetical protein
MLAAPHLSPADFAAPRRSESTDDLSSLLRAPPSPPRARPPLPTARTAAITATDPSLFIRGYGDRRAKLGPGGSTYAATRLTSAPAVGSRGPAAAASLSRLESMSDAELAAMGAWPAHIGDSADADAGAQQQQQQQLQRRQCVSCLRHFAVDRIEKHAAACVQARAETRLNTSPVAVGVGAAQTATSRSAKLATPGSPSAPRHAVVSTSGNAIPARSPARSSALKTRPQSAAAAAPANRSAPDSHQIPTSSSNCWRQQYLELQQGLRDASAPSALSC